MGEFITFLDSDDFFHPEMLEKMVAKAEEDGSDVVVAGYYMFDNKILFGFQLNQTFDSPHTDQT